MRDMANRWISSVVALAGTVAVVLVFLAVFGQESTDSTAGESADPAAAPPAATPTPGDSSPPSSDSPSPTATAPASTSATPAAKARVVVLNGAGVAGLATSTGRTIRAGGWAVTGVGDFSGDVGSNTVYYPAELKAAADSFVAAFPQIANQTRPTFAGLRMDRLTVVLVTDWRT